MTTTTNDNDNANRPQRRRSSVLSQLSLHSHFMSTLGLCSSVFTTFFILMSVFPYSGYMVLFLVPSATKETAGMYAGFLSSAFMVGRGCTSVLWGQLADIYGRKYVLVISLITSALGSVAFGCSTTFAMALIVRFVMGLCNGSMVVARTASSELAKGNKALESKGVGLIMSMVGYGMLIAPAVGGFLSEPLDQHPDNTWFQKYKGILEPFPFILPNLVAAVLAVVSLFLIILWVEETLPKHSRRDWWLAGKDLCMWIHKWTCMKRKERKKHPSVIKPATSIYVDDKNEESKDEFKNEFPHGDASSEFINANEQWDEEFQEEWEEAEDILDSMEFVVAATMCASREDRRSFVKALHQDPQLPTIPGSIREESSSSVQDRSDSSLPRVSFSNEETPLFSNMHKKSSYGEESSNAKVLTPQTLPEGRSVKRFASTTSNLTDMTKAGPTMQEIMSKPSTRSFLISYWIYSFASVAQSEAFPLFAMAHLGQGLGMQEASIGLVGTVSGLIYCIGQYFTFSFMMKRFGLLKSLRYGALFANLPVIFIPCSLYMVGWSQIGFLSLLQGVAMISGSVYLGCNTIGANRTVDSTSRATMNGLSSLGTSMGRGLGPIVAGFLVAGCMASGIIPDQVAGWVLYVVLLCMGLAAFWSTLSIPESAVDG